jgi:hypothetical protein
LALDAERDSSGLLSGVVDGVENGDGSLQVCMARGRQFDLSGAPDEEGDVEFPLQLPNLLGERWLRDVQSLGGPAEVQFLRDRAEVPEVTQFHD